MFSNTLNKKNVNPLTPTNEHKININNQTKY